MSNTPSVIDSYDPFLDGTTANALYEIDASAVAYGDSIMQGWVDGALDPPNGLVAAIETVTGWSITNAAVSSSLIEDAGQTDVILAATISESSKSLWLTGYNNMRAFGTTAANVAQFKNALMANAIWLSLPEAEKVRATDARFIEISGVWATASVYGNAMVRYTSTVGGAAAAFAYGTTVYVCLVGLNAGGGNITIQVDSGPIQTVSCSGIIATPAVRTYAPILVRIPGLFDGRHTVQVTCAGGGNVYVAYIVGNAAARGATAPATWIGKCLRMDTTGYALGSPLYNHGSDAAAANYVAAWSSAIQQLVADGLNISPVDFDFDPNNGDLGSDHIHPSAQGVVTLQKGFTRQMVSIAYANEHTGAARSTRCAPRATCTVNTQLINSVTPAAITGATATIYAPFDGIAVIHGDFDIEQLTAGLFVGDFYVDGVLLSTSGRIGFDPKAANARMKQSHTWIVPIAAGVSYTLALFAFCTGSFTVYGSTVGNSNTGFTAVLVPNP